MTPQAEIHRLMMMKRAWGRLFHLSTTVRPELERRGIYGKRSLGAALRKVDTWRHDSSDGVNLDWPAALNVMPHTYRDAQRRWARREG